MNRLPSSAFRPAISLLVSAPLVERAQMAEVDVVPNAIFERLDRAADASAGANLHKRLDEIARQGRGLAEMLRRVGGPAPSGGKAIVRSTLIKIATTYVLARIRNQPEALIAAQVYPDEARHHVLKSLADISGLLARAVVPPAITSVPGWAAEIANSTSYGALELIAPMSAYARLVRRSGLRIDLAGVASVRVPTRVAGSNLAGRFVSEGQPIPARQGMLGAVYLQPRKIGVVTVYSDELDRVSQVEAVLSVLLAEDTGDALDTVFLGNAAATVEQPAGLRYGAVPITSTDCQADVAALYGAIAPATDPVLVMREEDRLRMIGQCAAFSMLSVVTTISLPPKTIMAVDASRIASGEGDTPEFSTSREAVIVNRDDPGAAVASVPTTSLWQQMLIGLKLRQDVAWALRDQRAVAVIENITW